MSISSAKPTLLVDSHDEWDRLKGSFVTPRWSKCDKRDITWTKSEATFTNIRISDYVAILREVSLYPLWMPGCIAARLLRRVEPQESAVYIRFQDVEFYVTSCVQFHPELGCIRFSLQSDVEDGVTVTDKMGDMTWNILIYPLPGSQLKVQSLAAICMRRRIECDEIISPTHFLETTVARVPDIAAIKAFTQNVDYKSLMERDKSFYHGFIAPGVLLLLENLVSSPTVVGKKPTGGGGGGGTDDDAPRCPIENPIPMVRRLQCSGAAYTQAMVSYKTLIWGWVWVSLILFTVDRFWWDLWPLWVSKPLPDSDKTTTPVNIFLLWAWGSGRVSIITTFFLFLTQCRVTMNYIGQSAPSWLYVGDIHQINNDLHWWMGVLTGVAIILHVWIIFLPPIVDGTSMNLLPTQAARKKVAFYDADTQTLNLAPDDIWRLVEMTIMFGLFFPYSMSTYVQAGRLNRYTVSMWIHLIAGLGFAVDIIRKESHPHSHRINVPMCIYWILDRAVGVFLYRVNTATVVAMDPLDDRYIVVYVKFEASSPAGRSKHQIPGGEYVYLQFEGVQLDYAHPFTVFRNRGPLSGMRRGRPTKVTFENKEEQEEARIVFTRRASEEKVQYDTGTSGRVGHEGERNLFSEGKTKTSVWHKQKKNKPRLNYAPSSSGGGAETGRSSGGRPPGTGGAFSLGLGLGGGVGAISELKHGLLVNPSGGTTRPLAVSRRSETTRPSLVSEKLVAGKMSALPDYDFAAIVEVHKTEMDHVGVVRRKPWTQTLWDAHVQDKLVSLRCYGPYHAVFADLRSDHCVNLPGLLFVATGGGAAPVLDFHQYIVHIKLRRLRRPVMVIYSCNSPALFAYVTSVLFSTRIYNFYARGFITNSGNRGVTMEYSPFEEEEGGGRGEARKRRRRRERDIVGLNERMALDEEMEDAKSMGITDVYFCGAPGVGKDVSDNCRALGLRYHKGHTFG